MALTNSVVDQPQQARRKGVGGSGGHVPSHFLADQLTLFQPGEEGGAQYPHLILRVPPPGVSDIATALPKVLMRAGKLTSLAGKVHIF